VPETLKVSRLRAQELREQTVARYEQLVIDQEVRQANGCCPRCAASTSSPLIVGV
jgi:hypothetical protein